MITVDRKPVTFIQGDNMEYLRWCKEEMMRWHFSVGIVDPPYGIGVGSMNLGADKNSKPRKYEMGNWDNEVPTAEYWELLKYCCKNLIVWGGNYFSHYIPGSRCFIVWDKMNDGMSFAHGELALTTFDKNSCIIRRARNAAGTDETERRHPTQKPVYLYDYLHLNFVERQQRRVLDTHGGSCNHAIAAFKNNVQLTIIEREEGYFNSGLDAFDKSCKQGKLLF